MESVSAPTFLPTKRPHPRRVAPHSAGNNHTRKASSTTRESLDKDNTSAGIAGASNIQISETSSNICKSSKHTSPMKRPVRSRGTNFAENNRATADIKVSRQSHFKGFDTNGALKLNDPPVKFSKTPLDLSNTGMSTKTDRSVGEIENFTSPGAKHTIKSRGKLIVPKSSPSLVRTEDFGQGANPSITNSVEKFPNAEELPSQLDVGAKGTVCQKSTLRFQGSSKQKMSSLNQKNSRLITPYESPLFNYRPVLLTQSASTTSLSKSKGPGRVEPLKFTASKKPQSPNGSNFRNVTQKTRFSSKSLTILGLSPEKRFPRIASLTSSIATVGCCKSVPPNCESIDWSNPPSHGEQLPSDGQKAKILCNLPQKRNSISVNQGAIGGKESESDKDDVQKTPVVPLTCEMASLRSNSVVYTDEDNISEIISALSSTRDPREENNCQNLCTALTNESMDNVRFPEGDCDTNSCPDKNLDSSTSILSETESSQDYLQDLKMSTEDNVTVVDNNIKVTSNDAKESNPTTISPPSNFNDSQTSTKLSPSISTILTPSDGGAAELNSSVTDIVNQNTIDSCLLNTNSARGSAKPSQLTPLYPSPRPFASPRLYGSPGMPPLYGMTGNLYGNHTTTQMGASPCSAQGCTVVLIYSMFV